MMKHIINYCNMDQWLHSTGVGGGGQLADVPVLGDATRSIHG
jgi:hypothetical protein